MLLSIYIIREGIYRGYFKLAVHVISWHGTPDAKYTCVYYSLARATVDSGEQKKPQKRKPAFT